MLPGYTAWFTAHTSINSAPCRFIILGIWSDRNVVLAYLEWLKNELCVTSVDDLYDVAHEHVRALYGGSLLSKHGDVVTLFNEYLNDEFKIDSEKLWARWEKNVKSQLLLYRIIRRLLREEVLFNHTHSVCLCL